jgi:hypothetical protein
MKVSIETKLITSDNENGMSIANCPVKNRTMKGATQRS